MITAVAAAVPKTEEGKSKMFTLFIILAITGIIVLFFSKGLIKSVNGLFGQVADMGTSSLKTVRQVGRDVDPFNKKGKTRAVMRKVDPSKGLKKVGKKVGRAVKKVKFW